MSRVREISRAIRRVPGVRKVLEASDPQRRAARLAQSGLVDARLYAAQLGVPSLSVDEAALHYATTGFREGLTLNVLMDPYVIRRNLIRTDRPALYDYLNSRAWHAEVSAVWSRRAYINDHPDAGSHPMGPVGHLWQRVQADPQALVLVEPGGQRELPWSELYPALFDATVEWAALHRDRRARWARAELDHPRTLELPAPDDSGPVVSIVLPVWNRGAGLRRAVESVRAQTWTRWQLLIVDDGSWDDTPDLARLLAGRDDRIVFLPRAHEGVCAARNAGLAAATGEYVAFLDSDNVWEPEFLHDMVSSMRETGVETAYATIELVDGDGTRRYRYGSPSFDSLLAGNSIDMNVLVSTLAAVRAVGGFDEGLRRAVDYDLVLKLAARGPIAHVPTVGVVYDNDEQAGDRISTSEAVGWNTFVRLANAPDDRPPSLAEGTAVVLVAQRHDPYLPAKLVAVAEQRAETSVLIAAVGSKPDEWRSIVVAALGRDGLDARLHQDGEPWAYIANTTARRADRRRVLFVDPRTRFTATQLDELISAGADDAATMPVTAALDGSVESAGSLFAPPRSTPARIFEAHPVEDARALGDAYDVPALSGRTFSVATERFHAVGGFDPLLFNEYEAEGLSLRLAAAFGAEQRFVVAPQIVLPQGVPAIEFETRDARGTSLSLRALAAGVAPSDADTYYGRLGQTAGPWRMDEERRRLRPVVTRAHGTVALPDGRTVPRLRWSIRTASPAGPNGAGWGDTHFAESLADAFRALGQEAVVDAREADGRPSRSLDDVVIVLRGLDRVEPEPGQLSFLWVISHPDMVTRQEAEDFDGVFAASLSWSRTMSERWRVPIAPLLQCTDPSRFHPTGAPRTEEILFVGKSRGIPRPTVMEAVRGGVPITLYGGEWEKFIPAEAVTAEQVDNRELGALYGAASIVLNDHWADMKREGFISNRLFDVVAAGGRVLSDDVAGIDEIFGSAVHTFRTVSEIVPALRGDHDALFGAEDEIARISRRIRDEHSFVERARVLLDAATERLAAPTAR